MRCILKDEQKALNNVKFIISDHNDNWNSDNLIREQELNRARKSGELPENEATRMIKFLSEENLRKEKLYSDVNDGINKLLNLPICEE